MVETQLVHPDAAVRLSGHLRRRIPRHRLSRRGSTAHAVRHMDVRQAAFDPRHVLPRAHRPQRALAGQSPAGAHLLRVHTHGLGGAREQSQPPCSAPYDAGMDVLPAVPRLRGIKHQGCAVRRVHAAALRGGVRDHRHQGRHPDAALVPRGHGADAIRRQRIAQEQLHIRRRHHRLPADTVPTLMETASRAAADLRDPHRRMGTLLRQNAQGVAVAHHGDARSATDAGELHLLPGFPRRPAGHPRRGGRLFPIVPPAKRMVREL